MKDKKELNVIDIKALAFTKVEKVITTSLQHEDQLRTIIEFNEQNNYEYIIKSDGNITHVECINLMINRGYEISKYNTNELIFKHVNLKAQEEKEREQIKEIRGY